MKRIALFMLMVAASAAPAGAQARTYTDASKAQWAGVRDLIVKAADQMPEDKYAFKATPDVRSFGEIVWHVAGTSQGICGVAVGEKQNFGGPAKTPKAEIVAFVKTAFAACDAVFAKLDDTTGAEVVPMFDTPTPKLSILTFNTGHTWEHYGNLVTYLRLNKMVPPSSQK